MSYAGIEPWGRYFAETDEVYLWRTELSGARIRSLEDMQAIAGAVGRYQSLGLDLRGIAVLPLGDERYQLDAALTAKQHMSYLPGMATADDIAQKVQVALAGRFPGLFVGSARFEEINDDPPLHHALDFWRYQPVIWDIPGGLVLPFLDEGKPTQAYAEFRGLYRGRAEDGLNLKPWTEPTNGQPPVPPPGKSPPSSGGDTTILWIAGGLVAIWLAARVMKEQRA